MKKERSRQTVVICKDLEGNPLSSGVIVFNEQNVFNCWDLDLDRIYKLANNRWKAVRHERHT